MAAAQPWLPLFTHRGQRCSVWVAHTSRRNALTLTFQVLFFTHAFYPPTPLSLRSAQSPTLFCLVLFSTTLRWPLCGNAGKTDACDCRMDLLSGQSLEPSPSGQCGLWTATYTCRNSRSQARDGQTDGQTDRARKSHRPDPAFKHRCRAENFTALKSPKLVDEEAEGDAEPQHHNITAGRAPTSLKFSFTVQAKRQLCNVFTIDHLQPWKKGEYMYICIHIHLYTYIM